MIVEKMASSSAPTVDLNGFPPGSFMIRSVSNERLLDLAQPDKAGDGSLVHLWPQKETSQVESLRRPEADNQVFFIDNSTGALCCRVTGHAVDVEGDHLVLRYRRPIMQPYPNSYSHPLPKFHYAPKTGIITVQFSCDPMAHAAPGQPFSLPTATPPASYVLSAMPQRKPPGLLDNVNSFFAGAGALVAGRPPPPAPSEVFGGAIDLHEDELVDNERDDALEVDDDPAPGRDVLVVHAHPAERLGPRALARRRWEVIPLRATRAITGAM